MLGSKGHGHSHDHPGHPGEHGAGNNHEYPLDNEDYQEAELLHELPGNRTKTRIPPNTSVLTVSEVETDMGDVGPCPCCVHDPVDQLEKLQSMADKLTHRPCQETCQEEGAPEEAEQDEHVDPHSRCSHCSHEEEEKESEEYDDFDVHEKTVPTDTSDDASCEHDLEAGLAEEEKKKEKKVQKEMKEKKRLAALGMKTAIAIGVHNFPEGLATFVAALNEPRVGAVLAFAIAIHNIPEGLCVALPIYYSSGNRCKAFCWALLSGASEFVAALLGWAVLANSFSHTMYAVLFGMVSGMMVIISVRELLPTAHNYDSEDSVVTKSFIGGMALMALSLMLFLF